jgi:hypothetical protein
MDFLMMTPSIIRGWSTQQLDFVMANPQADISTNLAAFEGGQDTHCLHVLKNIYSGMDAGRTWNQYLVKRLRELVFEQSAADKCVFYRWYPD